MADYTADLYNIVYLGQRCSRKHLKWLSQEYT